jgi:hypothetical protein
MGGRCVRMGSLGLNMSDIPLRIVVCSDLADGFQHGLVRMATLRLHVVVAFAASILGAMTLDCRIVSVLMVAHLPLTSIQVVAISSGRAALLDPASSSRLFAHRPPTPASSRVRISGRV